MSSKATDVLIWILMKCVEKEKWFSARKIKNETATTTISSNNNNKRVDVIEWLRNLIRQWNKWNAVQTHCVMCTLVICRIS